MSDAPTNEDVVPTTNELLAQSHKLQEAGYRNAAAQATTYADLSEAGLRMQKLFIGHLESLSDMTGKWEEIGKDYLKQLRELRMATTTETVQLKSALSDIRKFFLDDRHPEEVKRLLEFVEVCERLKKLKQDGTLDAVADTILKLAK